MEIWRACPAGVSSSWLDGRECWGGLDIASTRDLASFVLVFPLPKEQYRVLSWFFCPKEAAARRDKSDRQKYVGWIPKYITATEGNRIDQETIRRVMWECSQRYSIQRVGFDPWNMDECYQQLIRDGWDDEKLVAMTQNHATYNEPMQKCLALVRDGLLHHGGNPVLTWNAANVVAKVDHNGNVKPDKGKSQDKIDGFCAMLMGLSGAIGSREMVIDYKPGQMFA
jgi:phage terminase large subunit-like protein